MINQYTTSEKYIYPRDYDIINIDLYIYSIYIFNRSDTGILSNKDHLPLTKLKFKDVGGDGQSASYTLGRLKCAGI